MIVHLLIKLGMTGVIIGLFMVGLAPKSFFKEPFTLFRYVYSILTFILFFGGAATILLAILIGIWR